MRKVAYFLPLCHGRWLGTNQNKCRARDQHLEALAQVHKYIKDNEEEMRYDVFRRQMHLQRSPSTEIASNSFISLAADAAGITYSGLF